SVLETDGDVDGAVACYRRALTLMPTRTWVLNRLAALDQTWGRNDRAITGLRRSLAVDPDQPGSRADLAYYHLFRPGVGLAQIRDLHA
ncbi:tetratricopeptide repeat protein, partial [Streptomyces galilaeus]|uniref:tetratricopeptide repeat protein n=1 Tax=Streptomyces galilaeus TaxID=33899 RepID=UPI0038F7C741